MWEFSLFRGLGLVMRTLPFIMFRTLVHTAIAAGLLLAVGLGAAAGAWLAPPDASGSLWGGVAGGALAAGAVFVLRDRLFCCVRARHVALLVEALEGRPVRFGQAQVALARSLVAERFGPQAALAALDQLVRSVLLGASRLVGELQPLLPLPVLNRLTGSARLQLRLGLGLVDAVVLAHALRTRTENAWEAAHDGLVLYVQNARSMLAAAAWLSLVGWAMAGLVFLALLAPAAGIAALVPPMAGAGPLLAAAIAWLVRAALIQPLALACMVQVYFRVTEGQEPQPEWRGRLTQISDKFRQLGERALEWRAGPAQDA